MSRCSLLALALLTAAPALDAAPSRPRVAPALARVAPAAALVAPPPRADDALERELAAVHALLDGPDRADAGARLSALLAAHRGHAALRARADELAGLARAARFAERWEPPPLTALLGGDEADWNPRTRELSVRYTRASPRAPEAGPPPRGEPDFHPLGFEVLDGLLVSRVPFSGSCRIEVSGRVPRAFVRDPPPALWLLTGTGLDYETWFTWPTTHERSVGKWTQGKLLAWRGGAATLLARDGTPGGKYDLRFDGDYLLKLRVTRRSLVASLNGFALLKSRKRHDGAGRLGLAHCPGIESVSVEGRVDAAWLHGLQRDAWEADLAAHLEQPPPDEALLPDWLADPSGSSD